MDVLVQGNELADALEQDKIQLAIVDEACGHRFHWTPLTDAPLVAVVPPDFPWQDETISLERLLPEIVSEVRRFGTAHDTHIPVIAAGGIYTGEDIYRIMELGADGVQMGTRFVTTEECDASTEFKRSYIEASQQDIEIIQSPVGMPGRAIHNSFLERVKQGLKQPKSCPFNCIKTCDVTHSPYCIIMALYNAFKGNLSAGYAFAGVNAWRAEKIESVKELMTNLIDEFDRFSLKKQLAKLKK